MLILQKTTLSIDHFSDIDVLQDLEDHILPSLSHHFPLGKSTLICIQPNAHLTSKESLVTKPQKKKLHDHSIPTTNFFGTELH